MQSKYINKPFLTQHHHNVLPIRWKFWMEHKQAKNIIAWHIDQHSDMAHPPSLIDSSQLYDEAYIYRYTQDICDIGNFIQPTLCAGIIQQCVQIRTEMTLLELDPCIYEDVLVILDIDIDFWAPEMVNDHIYATLEKTKILIARADLITIATSPGFIDQDLAMEYVQKLLN